ncbi:MAG TPA: PspC domain-containing protein [Allosphingosinicella sp.]|jgi:phage shock protein C
MRRKFHLDKRNGRFMGVCAGIADYFNLDATIVRIAAVVVTLLGAAPWTFILYGLTAWLARPKPAGSHEAEDIRALRGSTHDVRGSMRDIDRRMAEVETYVTSTNGRLAREIEELR